MTTIATDGKSMAGDTLTSCQGYVLAYGRKVHRCKDGRIFGCSGASTDTKRFQRWMMEGGDQPSLGDDFCVLILNPDGSVDWMDRSLEKVVYNLPAAIGSGQELAVGAMLAGASPGEAVAIAGKIDRKTGGDIHLEALP